MPKKKQPDENKPRVSNPNVMGLRAAMLEQPITETLETNFMPYAMSVIMSRAIPEIDGFKPSHRKLLYTMYEMGLLTKARTKSANIVGQTMRLNPHGDAAIYDTMVRLSKGYGALLHPFVDSKGNFGKVYSRDMAWAASRYTEAKLSPICQELFRDLDQDAVDFVDNYDNSMKEPALLPTTFPNILVSANMGIAVGMASQFCGFNLKEVCDTAAAYLKNPDCDLLDTLLARCVQDPATGEYRAEEAALELLLEEAAQKGDPVLARHPQAVENYFVCYLFSGLFPMLYHSRGLTLEENGVLLAEQYALFRILLGLLPAREGETTQQQLIRSVVALARITQHADLGRQVYDIGKAINLDSLAHAAYLLR